MPPTRLRPFLRSPSVPVRRASALGALVLSAACASQPAVEPLTVRRALGPEDLAYGGRVGGVSRPLAAAEFSAAPAKPAPGAATVAVHVKLYEVPSDAASALLGSAAPRAVCASMPDLATAERQLLARGANCVSAPSIELLVGQRGTIALQNDTAFVRAYTIEADQSAWIADPEVGTFQSGILLDVDPLSADGRVAFDLRLLGVVPLRTADIEVAMPVSGAPVTVQQPIVLEHALQAHAELAPDEVLVVGGLLTDRQGLVGVLCVDARSVTPGKTAAEVR